VNRRYSYINNAVNRCYSYINSAVNRCYSCVSGMVNRHYPYLSSTVNRRYSYINSAVNRCYLCISGMVNRYYPYINSTVNRRHSYMNKRYYDDNNNIFILQNHGELPSGDVGCARHQRLRRHHGPRPDGFEATPPSAAGREACKRKRGPVPVPRIGQRQPDVPGEGTRRPGQPSVRQHARGVPAAVRLTGKTHCK